MPVIPKNNRHYHKIDNSIDKIESIIQDYFLTSDNAPAAFRYPT